MLSPHPRPGAVSVISGALLPFGFGLDPGLAKPTKTGSPARRDRLSRRPPQSLGLPVRLPMCFCRNRN